MKRAFLALSMTGCLGLLVNGALAQDPPRRGGQGGPGGRGFAAGPVVAAIDADGDGEISAKEMENATAALKKLDKDGDGKLSAEEMRPARPAGAGGPGGGNPASREAMVERLMANDKNNDGKLSKDELPERMQALMDRADANKDGFLDKDELAKMPAPAGRGGTNGGAGGRPGGRGNRNPN